jgi:hypothetical protein
MKVLIILFLLQASSTFAFYPKLGEADISDPEILTVDEMRELTDQVEKVYQPIFETKGWTLKIEGKWESLRMNAQSEADRTKRKIVVYGGLGRARHITRDSFTLILCHELGHHLGGAPYMIGENEWASLEGQADYYAARTCMRLVLHASEKRVIVPKVVRRECQKAHPDPVDARNCMRTAKAGEDFGRRDVLLNNYNEQPKYEPIVSLLTPSDERWNVTKTNRGYPFSQCRVDTFYQGALDHERPRCWFHKNE